MYEFERNKLKAYLGDSIYSALKSYKCFVAGGTITSLFCNREINDVDIYFRSNQDIKDFILQEVKGNSKMWIVAKTKKALLIKSDDILIQLICFKTFENVDSIFRTFDFDICMGAFDFENEEFILHNNFLKHNSQRLLMFNKDTAYPIVSALRVDKYKKKGYSISKTEYLRVLLTCMELNIDNYEDLKDQLGGMYGVDYDEVIKPLEGEEFNLGSVIEKMSEIINHQDYFKEKVTQVVEIDNWNVLISEITDEKIKYYKINEKVYIHDEDDGFVEYKVKNVEDNNRFIRGDFESDFFKDGIYVYKNVFNNCGRYFSFYDKKFEYRIGEMAIARGKDWMGTGVGLYVSKLEDVLDKVYSDNAGSVVMELKVDSINDFVDLEEFTVSKAIPTRILSDEELKKLKIMD